MSKPEDIPQDIWETAQSINQVLPYSHVQGRIARAIMEEREACAEMAELVGIPMAANGAQVLMIPVRIADRIRKRGDEYVSGAHTFKNREE